MAKKPKKAAEEVVEDIDEEMLDDDLELGDVDEFEGVGPGEELDDVDLDELADEDLDGLVDDDIDGLVDDEELVDDVIDELDEEAVTIVPLTAVEDDDFDEDEMHPDDVEASLDVILKDRLVIEDVEVDDEDQPDTDDRAEGVSVVIPKRPDEFVCQSCFLVKHPSQLADKPNSLFRDCV